MKMDLKALMDSKISDHQDAIGHVQVMTDGIARVAQSLVDCVARGGRIYLCGNGGSASDAQHFAAELTGRFVAERPGYPAVALTTDTSALTSIGNDYSFDRIFGRQLEALGRRGDCLVGLSTSGNSRNIVEAVRVARELDMSTVGLFGRDGGVLGSLVDYPLTVPVNATARIQEAHILIIHLLCEAFEP